MIAIVAPEPAAWLAPLLSCAEEVSETIVFAPWALRGAAPQWLPGRFLAPWRRRSLAGLVAARQPFWGAAEAILRGWAGSHTERLMQERFLKRSLAGWLASRWLPKQVRLVMSPSLAARRVFAKAAQWGAKCVLVEDLPGLRGMHHDLDRAADSWPQSSFLHRYRAPASLVATQEAEQLLADLLLVRGHFAQESRQRSGISPEKIVALPAAPIAPLVVPASNTQTLLLAGLAAARSGVLEALRALEALPGVTLLVRAGPGAAPDDLLARPNVRSATREEREGLRGVAAVLAPAWCESYSPEVMLAAASGVPVIATSRGAGFVSLSAPNDEVAPGDWSGLQHAILACLQTPRATPPATPQTESLTKILSRFLTPAPV